MNYFFCILTGYLIGSLNPSYFISQLKGGDIRSMGTGNAGASNAMIHFGKKVGVLCAVFDIAKACFAVWLMCSVFSDLALAYALTGASCVLGHIFPFYMGFRGGKGLASLGGVIIMFDWRVFLVLLAFEMVLVFSTRYICVVPMTASVLLTVLYGIMRRDVIGTVLFAVVSIVIIVKHRSNVKRIFSGTEIRIDAFWNKKKELERVEKNKTKKENTK